MAIGLPQTTPTVAPNQHVQMMLQALRAPTMPPVAQSYAPQPVNLNPNLAKAAARVQLAVKGQSKPTAADWG